MRFLKQYGGVILLLIVVAVLIASFYAGILLDAEVGNTILGVSLVFVILSIVLMIVGGKSADKIGGK